MRTEGKRQGTPWPSSRRVRNPVYRCKYTKKMGEKALRHVSCRHRAKSGFQCHDCCQCPWVGCPWSQSQQLLVSEQSRFDNSNTRHLGLLSVLYFALNVLNLWGIMLACEANIPSPTGRAELKKVSAQLLVWVWCTMEIKPSRVFNLGGFQGRKAAELIKKLWWSM